MTIIPINAALYPFRFDVVIIDHDYEYANYLTSKGLKYESVSDVEMSAVAHYFKFIKPDGSYLAPHLLLKRGNYDYSTIVHELAHISLDILRYVHIDLTVESEESLCYLLDYLFKTVTEAIDKEDAEIIKDYIYVLREDHKETLSLEVNAKLSSDLEVLENFNDIADVKKAFNDKVVSSLSKWAIESDTKAIVADCLMSLPFFTFQFLIKDWDGSQDEELNYTLINALIATVND